MRTLSAKERCFYPLGHKEVKERHFVPVKVDELTSFDWDELTCGIVKEAHCRFAKSLPAFKEAKAQQIEAKLVTKLEKKLDNTYTKVHGSD